MSNITPQQHRMYIKRAMVGCAIAAIVALEFLHGLWHTYWTSNGTGITIVYALFAVALLVSVVGLLVLALLHRGFTLDCRRLARIDRDLEVRRNSRVR